MGEQQRWLYYLLWPYLLWLPREQSSVQVYSITHGYTYCGYTRRSASDDIVDFEAFVKQTPKTLRTSLIRLAKENGNDLGFLA